MKNLMRLTEMLENNNVEYANIHEEDRIRMVFPATEEDDYIVVTDDGRVHANNISNITLESAESLIRSIAARQKPKDKNAMKIERMRVEFWLNDLAEKTQGTLYKRFNDPFIIYQVRNEQGVIELKWRSDFQTIKNVSYGADGLSHRYIETFMELMDVIDSIRDKSLS